MLALSNDAEAGFFQGSDRAEVRYAGKGGMGLCRHFDFANVSVLDGVVYGREVFDDRGADVFDSFRLGRAL